MKRKLMLFLSLLFISIGIVTAQTQVRGVVVDEAGEPVIGATILIKGTSQGTITDFEGNFALTTPTNATLIVSYVGMNTREVAVKSSMRIVMQTDAELLDEVIVVAFGTAKKSAFTGSAKVIDTEQLSKSQVTSVTNALAGAVPGLQLTSDNGAPGATAKIKIRGFSSLNAGTDPLIILDGAPYSGDLGNLNPNDVESMTVLKDAASNALYGARGANGVIMITTKQAKKGRGAVITFDAKYGGNVQALQRYNTITDPAHYLETHYGALTSSYNKDGMSPIEGWELANSRLFGDQSNGGLGYNVYSYPQGQMLIGLNGKLNPEATLGRIESYKGEEYLVTPDDWQNIGTQTGVRKEYNLSIGGSSEKSSIYFSLGYLNNEGITKASNLERLTARMRADYQAKDWLKVGGNMSYAKFEHNSLANNGSSNSSGNIWAFTSQMAPIYPAYIRNADGSIKVDSDELEMMDYGDGTNAGFARPFISDANPIMDSQLNTNHSEGNATSGSGFMDFVFIPELKFTVNGAFNLDESRITYVYNPYYGQFDTTGGLLSKYHTRRYDYNLQQLLNYSNSFNSKNNFDILLGHEYYNYAYFELGASKSKMFSQKNKELGGAVLDEKSADSFINRDNNEGYFTRVQYNYDEKIFASGSFRRDASSKFHPDHRWGNFWSLGGAWLLNKEDWFDIDWLDELKVKASYGMQGNDAIGRYRYTDVFNIVNADGNIGTSFETKGTKDITWETNANFNIGTEFSLFNRITGSLEFYNRKTTNMLFSFSVAPSLGYKSYYDNVGDLYNRGLELELAANIIKTRNLSWDVNLNVSTLKNGITMLDEDKKTASLYDSSGKEYKGYASGNFFIGEDVSMYTWRLREFAGINEEGESMWYKTIFDEDDNFKEREKTNKYADADYYVTNQTTIPNVYGGFGTSLKAYGLDFNINFSYQIGGKQYDGTYARFMGSPTGSSTGYNFHVDVLNSWTPENKSSEIPRFMYGDIYSAGGSTRFLTDASYLNIENINLGYTLPVELTKKAQINSIRIYASAENVFYWSKRKGFDPRQSYNATTNATYYSPMRTISGGITLNF